MPGEGLGGFDGGAPPSTVPHPDVVGPSTTVATPPDIVGPSTTAVTQLDVAELSSVLDAAKEACEMKTGSDTVPVERVLDEKGSPRPIVPPSWEEMMEMLKRVPCFKDAEAPYTKNVRLLSPYQADICEYG